MDPNASLAQLKSALGRVFGVGVIKQVLLGGRILRGDQETLHSLRVFDGARLTVMSQSELTPLTRRLGSLLQDRYPSTRLSHILDGFHPAMQVEIRRLSLDDLERLAKARLSQAEDRVEDFNVRNG